MGADVSAVRTFGFCSNLETTMRTKNLLSALSVSFFCLAVASCEKAPSGSGTVGSVDDVLSIIPPEEELKCTGGGGSGTVCTSDFAFVCPEGWSACPLEGDNKTCCKKD
jgi:hypothetical protein